MGLKRRSFSNFDAIVGALENHLQESGSIVGYRAMWHRLRVEDKLSVSKEFVRKALKILDPEGVERRLKHRLKRRKYNGKGPNFIWHIDGYDKLKPFGLCIHGCIDGFSRRIMWLEVATTNNHPSVIAKYFLDCVQELGGTARVVRADNGTENVRVAGIQRFLRHSGQDTWSDEKSFLYGKSVSNQRIEAWWGQLRKGVADWWISHFKDLRESGYYCDVNIIHVECLQFCYMPVIQEELHRAAKLWNLHHIRPSTNDISPHGRPDMLYFLPELTNTVDYKHRVDIGDIDICRQMCCYDQPHITSSPEYNALAECIMTERGLSMPTTGNEAKGLYVTLVKEIEDII